MDLRIHCQMFLSYSGKPCSISEAKKRIRAQARILFDLKVCEILIVDTQNTYSYEGSIDVFAWFLTVAVLIWGIIWITFTFLAAFIVVPDGHSVKVICMRQNVTVMPHCCSGTALEGGSPHMCGGENRQKKASHFTTDCRTKTTLFEINTPNNSCF